MTDTSSGGALEGIKVVEMGQLIAGPFCGQLLGDMGAEIVKLEPPVTGDQPPMAASVAADCAERIARLKARTTHD